MSERLGSRPHGGEAQTLGHDVSGHQGDVDWPAAARTGAKFVYVKATEGTGFVNARLLQQYNGSYHVGLVRGAYHFARSDISDGASQAHYFVDYARSRWAGKGLHPRVGVMRSLSAHYMEMKITHL